MNTSERDRRTDLARYVASVGLCASVGVTILYLGFGLGTLPFTFRSASDSSSYRAAVHSLLLIWLMPCAQVYAIVALIKRSRRHCAIAVALLLIGSVGFQVGVRLRGEPAGDPVLPEVLTGLVPDLLVVAALGWLVGHRAWWTADRALGTWGEWLFAIALPVAFLQFVVASVCNVLAGLAGLDGIGAVAFLAGPLIAARFYRRTLAPDVPSDARTTGLVLLLVALLPVVAVQAYSSAHMSSPDRAVVPPAFTSFIACGVGMLVVGCVLLLGFRARRKELEPNR